MVITAPSGPYRWSLSRTMITAPTGPYRWSLSRTMITTWTKKSDFLAEISSKNRLLASTEKTFATDNWMEEKLSIFPPKNHNCGACAGEARFGQKNRR